MFAGIALFGRVTAALASLFVESSGEHDAMRQRDRMQAQIDAWRSSWNASSVAAGLTTRDRRLMDVQFLLGKRVRYRGRVGTVVRHNAHSDVFAKEVVISFPETPANPQEVTVPRTYGRS